MEKNDFDLKKELEKEENRYKKIKRNSFWVGFGLIVTGLIIAVSLSTIGPFEKTFSALYGAIFISLGVYIVTREVTAKSDYEKASRLIRIESMLRDILNKDKTKEKMKNKLEYEAKIYCVHKEPKTSSLIEIDEIHLKFELCEQCWNKPEYKNLKN